MAQDPLTVIQTLYGAFGAGDIPKLLSMLTEDVSWEVMGQASAYPMFGKRIGPAGALEFFHTLGAVEDITAFEPLSFHPSGDTVLVQGRLALRLKTNGADLAYDWAHIFTVRDGKIASFREFYDTAQVVEAYRR